jgi:hypothetical protein
MLEHFFWLLEFKFKFEFYCLNPFSKYLNPIPKTPTLSPFQPIGLRSPAPTPASPTHSSRLAAQPAPASRPSSQQAQQPCKPAAAHQPAWPFGPSQPTAAAAPLSPRCEADLWGPLVIPELRVSPPRTPLPPPSPSGARFPVRGPHAKESARAFISCAAPRDTPHPSRPCLHRAPPEP